MKKNVLFILADQFRADCIGAAGNPLIQTPHLDALAREGVLFEKCFVQATPCAPSRMAIFTGRYMCSTGCVDNGTPLVDAEDNLAMHLKNQGVPTASLGFNDYPADPRILPEGHRRKTVVGQDNFLPGLDFVYEHCLSSPTYFNYLRQKGYPESVCNRQAICTPDAPEDAPADRLPCSHPAHYKAEDSEGQFITTKAVDYIEENRGTGWFLNLNYVKPHPPFICPAPYHAMYDPAAMPAPTRRPEELAASHPYLGRFAVNSWPKLEDEAELRQIQACYYGMISELDACLGRVFQALKDTGQWDSTLIVFSADHGEALGDHYLRDKAHFYDAAMRVPLVVRDPSHRADATRGQCFDGLCESIDAAPTICEFLGLPPHERFQGRSVLDMLHGLPGAKPRERIHYEFYYHYSLKPEEKARVNPDECILWVVRDNDFKYVQFGEKDMPPLLFDLKADPNEFHNCAADPAYAAKVAEYCQHLLRWRMRHEDRRMERWARERR